LSPSLFVWGFVHQPTGVGPTRIKNYFRVWFFPGSKGPLFLDACGHCLVSLSSLGSTMTWRYRCSTDDRMADVRGMVFQSDDAKRSLFSFSSSTPAFAHAPTNPPIKQCNAICQTVFVVCAVRAVRAYHFAVADDAATAHPHVRHQIVGPAQQQQPECRVVSCHVVSVVS
jgi:hypothetical protein